MTQTFRSDETLSSGHPRRFRQGFTLVELLVVIGIIALLISILLPALNKARAAANTIKCSANLRSIGQAMQMYASENKGFIPGSGYTSGRMYFTTSTYSWGNSVVTSGNIPTGAPISPLDWMTPIIHEMGIRIPDAVDSSTNEGVRYAYMTTLQEFICPSNVGTASSKYTGSTGADAGVVQATSYVAAISFLLSSGDQTGYSSLSRVTPTGAAFVNPPSKYVPNLGRISNGPEKIFMADAGKYINSTNGEINPTYDLSPNTTYSGTYGYNGNWSDFGAYDSVSSSWDRSWAPGNTHTGKIDPRPLIFRHGTARGGYRMNACFYDGHVETLGDLTAANPRYWMPTGSTWGGSSGIGSGVFAKIWPDVVSKYQLTSTYTAPMITS